MSSSHVASSPSTARSPPGPLRRLLSMTRLPLSGSSGRAHYLPLDEGSGSEINAARTNNDRAPLLVRADSAIADLQLLDSDTSPDPIDDNDDDHDSEYASGSGEGSGPGSDEDIPTRPTPFTTSHMAAPPIHGPTLARSLAFLFPKLAFPRLSLSSSTSTGTTGPTVRLTLAIHTYTAKVLLKHKSPRALHLAAHSVRVMPATRAVDVLWAAQIKLDKALTSFADPRATTAPRGSTTPVRQALNTWLVATAALVPIDSPDAPRAIVAPYLAALAAHVPAHEHAGLQDVFAEPLVWAALSLAAAAPSTHAFVSDTVLAKARALAASLQAVRARVADAVELVVRNGGTWPGVIPLEVLSGRSVWAPASEMAKAYVAFAGAWLAHLASVVRVPATASPAADQVDEEGPVGEWLATVQQVQADLDVARTSAWQQLVAGATAAAASGAGDRQSAWGRVKTAVSRILPNSRHQQGRLDVPAPPRSIAEWLAQVEANDRLPFPPPISFPRLDAAAGSDAGKRPTKSDLAVLESHMTAALTWLRKHAPHVFALATESMDPAALVALPRLAAIMIAANPERETPKCAWYLNQVAQFRALDVELNNAKLNLDEVAEVRRWIQDCALELLLDRSGIGGETDHVVSTSEAPGDGCGEVCERHAAETCKSSGECRRASVREGSGVFATSKCPEWREPTQRPRSRSSPLPPSRPAGASAWTRTCPTCHTLATRVRAAAALAATLGDRLSPRNTVVAAMQAAIEAASAAALAAEGTFGSEQVVWRVPLPVVYRMAVGDALAYHEAGLGTAAPAGSGGWDWAAVVVQVAGAQFEDQQGQPGRGRQEQQQEWRLASTRVPLDAGSAGPGTIRRRDSALGGFRFLAPSSSVRARDQQRPVSVVV